MAVLDQPTTLVVPRGATPDQSHKPVANQRRTVTAMQCLVVSTVAERAAMLDGAARKAGWDTIVCRDIDAGWIAVTRQRFQLALIDFWEVKGADELRQLSEDVCESKKTLLVLCGNEGDVREEVWARQVGAWLYLPGVSESSDMTMLCREAQPVAKKLTGDPTSEPRISGVA